MIVYMDENGEISLWEDHYKWSEQHECWISDWLTTRAPETPKSLGLIKLGPL